MNDCTYIFFVSHIDVKNRLRIISTEFKNFEKFTQIFLIYSKIYEGFKLINSFEDKNFEILLFGQKNLKDKSFGFFKGEKTKLSKFSQSFGVRASYIVNNYSIELFAMDFKDNLKTSQEKIQQILKKYIDKSYDLIFVVGNIANYVQLDYVNGNYDLLFEHAIQSSKESNRSNQVHLLCSKKLINKSLEPLYKKTEIEPEGMTSQMTINAHRFVLNGLLG